MRGRNLRLLLTALCCGFVLGVRSVYVHWVTWVVLVAVVALAAVSAVLDLKTSK
jgi:hypothetical protein